MNLSTKHFYFKRLQATVEGLQVYKKHPEDHWAGDWITDDGDESFIGYISETPRGFNVHCTGTDELTYTKWDLKKGTALLLLQDIGDHTSIKQLKEIHGFVHNY